MPQRIILLLIVLSCFTVGCTKSRTYKFDKRCSWSEGFKGSKLNIKNWNYHIGKFDKEKEYYTDSIGNVFVKGGYLHIAATKNSREDKICSSGRIHTLGKQSFLYGKIVIRAKIPTGKGIFPAIWMLREDHPRTIPLGEIDIMEYTGCYEKKQYCTTTHIVDKEPGKKEKRYKHYANVKADMDKFHIYTLEWTPESLVFKLDNKTVYSLNKAEAEFWPFDDPYYLILNVAYGSWGAECGFDNDIFPQEMIVDWIRYYKLIK